MNLILLCPKYSVDDKIHSSNVVKIRKKESKGVHWTIFEWFFTKKVFFLVFVELWMMCLTSYSTSLPSFYWIFWPKGEKRGDLDGQQLQFSALNTMLDMAAYFYCFIESLKQTTTVPYFLDALVASSLTQENQIQAKSAQNQYLRQVLASCF